MLNRQITMGRLTSNPELKTTQSGVSVCSFTIASEEDIRREDNTRDTDFVDCVAWRQTAEFISRYMQKGRMIVVEGRPKTRKYKDKNDVTHKVTELRVDRAYPADSKPQNGSQESQPKNYAEPEGGDFVEINDDTDLPF